jgi:hypothetical protein
MIALVASLAAIEAWLEKERLPFPILLYRRPAAR